MAQNPFKFDRSLDPVTDSMILIPMTSTVVRVIEEAQNSNYSVILGPRFSGKTTLLNQIQNKLPQYSYMYYDFRIPGPNVDYPSIIQSLAEKMVEEIPSNLDKKEVNRDILRKKSNQIDIDFITFLEIFKPKTPYPYLILLFDNIHLLPDIPNFLKMWRKVLHERYWKKELQRYSLVMTASSVDLIKITDGPTSPFNVAYRFFLNGISDEESARLIEEPLKQTSLAIQPGALNHIISQTRGHMQMIQQVCSYLADSHQPGEEIALENVEDAIQRLLSASPVLNLLQSDLTQDEELLQLVHMVLSGEKIKYHLNKYYSIFGAGAIREENSLCSILNPIVEQFIRVKIFKEQEAGV